MLSWSALDAPPMPVLGALGMEAPHYLVPALNFPCLAWVPWGRVWGAVGLRGVLGMGTALDPLCHPCPRCRPIRPVSRPAGSGDKGVRRRRGPGGGAQGSAQSRAREVRVESLQRVRTDFSPDALQKAVRFSADGALLATGGADGFLRLWEVGTAGWGTRGEPGWAAGSRVGMGGWDGHRRAEGGIAVPTAAHVGQGRLDPAAPAVT